ncbi:alpha/beta hydrolase [Lutibacter holmesii]|uniref:Alpha/beta hydrolase n=1 Tax=Lutibacter holmesii TaxID=1137985 RepID=A0ABW3WRF3_9FLAO
MKYFKNQKLFVYVFIFISIQIYSQEYSTEIIKLWEGEKTPFNKENIKLKETLDEAGKRYTQISEPTIYVYRNKEIKNNGAALLVCPGGGYAKVAIGNNNGESSAKHFLKMGFNVVAVLKYRLPDTLIVYSQEKVPLCDAQKALSIIHQNSSTWSIDKDKIAVMGSSAGGHLAASLVNLQEQIIAPGVKPEDLTLAASILLYPVVSFNLPYRHKGSYKYLLADKSNDQTLLDYYSMENKVSKNTTPTYIIHALDDSSVVYQNSLLYCESLKKHNVTYKYVELEKGGHGFGFNFKKTGVDWTIDLEKWLHTETNLFKN